MCVRAYEHAYMCLCIHALYMHSRVLSWRVILSLQEITIEEGSHVRLRVMGTRVDATEIVSVVTCVHTVQLDALV